MLRLWTLLRLRLPKLIQRWYLPMKVSKDDGSMVQVARKADRWQIVAPKQLVGDTIVIQGGGGSGTLVCASVITPHRAICRGMVWYHHNSA
jgi:hypothetical protein